MSEPPTTLCLGKAGGRLFLEMALDEGWHDSSAVKGRIRVTAPDGTRAVSYLGNFSRGDFSVRYTPRLRGRYRVAYAWCIPRTYLLRQPLRAGARSFYRVDRWQTAAVWFTRALTCRKPGG